MAESTCFDLLSPYSIGNWVCVGYQTQMKSTQKKRNVHGQRKNFAFGTKRNLYSTDLRLGFAFGNTNFRFGVGCFRVLRYQHVGIGNAKPSHWECNPTQGPDASAFASHLNIGFTVFHICDVI